MLQWINSILLCPLSMKELPKKSLLLNIYFRYMAPIWNITIAQVTIGVFFFSKKIDKVVHVLQQMIYINNSSPIIYVKHYRYFSSRIIDDILVFMSSCIGYWYWLSISLLSRLGKRKKIKICFIKQNPKILNSFCLADKSTY